MYAGGNDLSLSITTSLIIVGQLTETIKVYVPNPAWLSACHLHYSVDNTDHTIRINVFWSNLNPNYNLNQFYSVCRYLTRSDMYMTCLDKIRLKANTSKY